MVVEGKLTAAMTSALAWPRRIAGLALLILPCSCAPEPLDDWIGGASIQNLRASPGRIDITLTNSITELGECGSPVKLTARTDIENFSEYEALLITAYIEGDEVLIRAAAGACEIAEVTASD